MRSLNFTKFYYAQLRGKNDNMVRILPNIFKRDKKFSTEVLFFYLFLNKIRIILKIH